MPFCSSHAVLVAHIPMTLELLHEKMLFSGHMRTDKIQIRLIYWKVLQFLVIL